MLTKPAPTENSFQNLVVTYSGVIDGSIPLTFEVDMVNALTDQDLSDIFDIIDARMRVIYPSGTLHRDVRFNYLSDDNTSTSIPV